MQAGFDRRFGAMPQGSREYLLWKTPKASKRLGLVLRHRAKHFCMTNRGCCVSAVGSPLPAGIPGTMQVEARLPPY